MRKHTAVAAVLVLFGVTELLADSPSASLLRVVGSVSAAARPVENAMIVAFGLSNFETHHTSTDRGGSFELLSLPSGVYRVIAVKQGFAPAVATILPHEISTRLAFRLKEGKGDAQTRDQIWEIRRSLPKDVLREIDAVLQFEAGDTERSRLQGEMFSMTGIASEDAGAAFSQTAVALQGRMGDRWRLDVAGRHHQVQESFGQLTEPSLAQSSGLVMAFGGGDQTLRVASTRNWWRVDERTISEDDRVDLQSHKVEWQSSDSQVELRYHAHQNVFSTNGAGSETFELAGRRVLMDSSRGELDVEVRVWQESRLGAIDDPHLRMAAVATGGRYLITDGVGIQYGLYGRVSEHGSDWMPHTGAELQVGRRGAIVVSGGYKLNVSDRDVHSTPLLISSADPRFVAPRYRYSVGYVAGDRNGSELSAVMTVSSVDSLMAIIFDDPTLEFWDGYYLEPGDLHRDLTVAWRHLGERVAIDLQGTAARTEGVSPLDTGKHYMTGNVRSLFKPSGTSVDLVYRWVEQPDRAFSPLDLSGERLNIRMGQSLHLPLDLTLLVGFDLSRTHNSVAVADGVANGSLQKRYVGGVSFAF
jgi:hypothetical protein